MVFGGKRCIFRHSGRRRYPPVRQWLRLAAVRRRHFLAALLAVPFLGEARAQPRPRRVAVVTLGALERQPVVSLLEGLRELGYEQGRNIEILAPSQTPRIATCQGWRPRRCRAGRLSSSPTARARPGR